MSAPAQQTAATVLGWLADGRRVAGGVLVAVVEGSAPFQPGAAVFIDVDGAIEGNVTGGCVESAVAEESAATLHEGAPPRVLTYGVSDELAQTVGLRCGGTVHVLVSEVSGDAREATDRALQAVRDDTPHAVARLLNGPRAGAVMYVDADARVGSLLEPDGTDGAIEQAARGALVEGRSGTRRFAANGAALGSELEVHISVQAEPRKMLIFGAIDYSVAVASLAASAGYEITIADPRAGFLASDRFSAVAETVSAWPDAVFDDLPLGPRDAVLVFTHDFKLDVPAIQGALAGGAGYVGALGSRKTTRAREERLREAGVSDDAIARVHAPCGLDIGAASVVETAIAVMAEITALRAGRSGGFLRDASSSIRRREAA